MRKYLVIHFLAGLIQMPGGPNTARCTALRSRGLKPDKAQGAQSATVCKWHYRIMAVSWCPLLRCAFHCTAPIAAHSARPQPRGLGCSRTQDDGMTRSDQICSRESVSIGIYSEMLWDKA